MVSCTTVAAPPTTPKRISCAGHPDRPPRMERTDRPTAQTNGTPALTASVRVGVASVMVATVVRQPQRSQGRGWAGPV